MAESKTTRSKTRSNGTAPSNSRPAPKTPAKTKSPAKRTWQDVVDTGKRTDMPAGLWMRCPSCSGMLYRPTLEQNLFVCPDCDHHFRINGTQRAHMLCDPGSFEPMWENIRPSDPLKFVDLVAYKDRIKQEQKKTGRPEAIVAGKGFIKGRGVVLACLDSSFRMGSMGSVVGEVLTRAIELATESDLPLIIASASGGARMQESTMSLLQMAKTSSALATFDDAGGLFISLLTDPTTGGVTASFAMLGDVIFAEPKALVCFAGPRVIANTVRQELPPGFQRSEHLMEKGFVDRVISRVNLRSEISRVIDFAGK